MYYYKFHIGDYKAATDHLDLMEDLAYRRMLDWCYLNERSLPLDLNDIAKRILMRTHNECIANVLNEYFTKTDKGYENNRVSFEVSQYKTKSYKAKLSAKARWNKDKAANAMRTHSDGNANHKPLTNNHKPLTNNQVKEKKTTALPLDYSQLGFTDNQIDDLKRIRKANKGTKLTQRIVNALAVEFHNAASKGYSFDELLTEWEVRGWKSFKADWIDTKQSNDAPQGLSKLGQKSWNNIKDVKLTV